LAVTAASAVYSTSISVLAIIFAVFFAALAVIITAPVDDFIRFMEQGDQFYTELVRSYRWCLYWLFGALASGMVLFTRCAFVQHPESYHEPRWVIVSFVSIVAYALAATLSAVGDCITFAQTRAEFAMRRH
jgi:hypothetical protein